MPAALYSQLQQVALTGTRRLPLSKLTSNLASAQNPIAQALHCALNQADTPDPLRLLRALAIAAVTERATWQATAMDPETTTHTMPPVPAEPPFADEIVQTMREFITMAHTGSYLARFLLIMLLRYLHQAKQSLPPELLVRALALGSYRPGHSTDKALRPYLLPVLGARGYWLAQQNPAWQWAVWLPSDAEQETIWQQGNLEQRQYLLLEQRKTDPDAARERFAASFEQINSKERIALIETLEINLSMADEPFLEGLLQRTDRAVGKNLRKEIVNLLNKLAQSRHCQRIIAIVQDLLQQDEKGAWHIEPPEDFDPAWERDGISSENFLDIHNRTIGRRGACLRELVYRTPLSFWTQTTGMAPDELFKWANTTPWKKELHWGWLARIQEGMLNPDHRWAALYLDNINGHYNRIHFLEKLTQNQRETVWLAGLPTHIDSAEIERCQWYEVKSLSIELSQQLIKSIRLLAKRLKFRIDSALTKLTNAEIKDKPEALHHLHNLVIHLDDSVLPEIDSLLHTYQDQWSRYWPDMYQETSEKLKMRYKLQACQAAISARAQAALQ